MVRSVRVRALLGALLLAGCSTSTPGASDAAGSRDSGAAPTGCVAAPIDTVPAGTRDLLAADARVYAGASTDHTGRQLHAAGDLDGDGCGDLLVQATGLGTDGAKPTPVHFVVDGPLAAGGLIAGVASAVLTDTQSHLHSEWDGNPTVAAGDLDGDGRDDLAIAPTVGNAAYGDPLHAPVYLLAGGRVTTSDVQANPVLVADDAACSQWGLFAGDWNGDGYVDLGAMVDAAHPTGAWGSLWFGPFPEARGCLGPDAVVTAPAGPDADRWVGDTPAGGDLDGDGGDELVLVLRGPSEEPYAVRQLVVLAAGADGYDVNAPLARLEDRFAGDIVVLPDRDGDGFGELAATLYTGDAAAPWDLAAWSHPLEATRAADAELHVGSASVTQGAADGGALLGGDGSTLLVGDVAPAAGGEAAAVCAIAPGRIGQLAAEDCDLRVGAAVSDSAPLGFTVVPDVDGFGTFALAMSDTAGEGLDATSTVWVWMIAP